MAVVKPTKQRENLLDLPFDQYSRQYVVKELINRGLRTKKQSFKIIDLGGHKGKTQQFMPTDEITILDVFDEEYAGYIKGDATNMTFADKAFDIACSFDVFEHIPRSKRLAFIREALRVTTQGVFIAMPVDEPGKAVSRAEETLNAAHHTLYGSDHQWLKEHIDYRIPNKKEVETLIEEAGAAFVSLTSNQITDWQLLQSIIFIAARNPHATLAAQELNRWYNQHIGELEKAVDNGYRGIYFISHDKALVARVGAVVDDLLALKKDNTQRYIRVHQGVLEQSIAAMTKIASSFLATLEQEQAHETRLHALEEAISDEKARTDHAAMETKALAQQLQTVYASKSWRITAPLRVLLRAIRH